MRKYLSLAGIAVALTLAACASRPPAPTTGADLLLLPPRDLTTELLLTQKLTLQANGRERQFLAVVRLERKRVKLVVMAPAGQQLLLLDYDGETLLQHNGVADGIPGREILASLQFALWPEDSIRREYRKIDGWQVEIDKLGRSLLTRSGAVLIIRRDPGIVSLENLWSKYRVLIETLERAEL